jgi:hypothetical protein
MYLTPNGGSPEETGDSENIRIVESNVFKPRFFWIAYLLVQDSPNISLFFGWSMTENGGPILI